MSIKYSEQRYYAMLNEPAMVTSIKLYGLRQTRRGPIHNAPIKIHSHFSLSKQMDTTL